MNILYVSVVYNKDNSHFYSFQKLENCSERLFYSPADKYHTNIYLTDFYYQIIYVRMRVLCWIQNQNLLQKDIKIYSDNHEFWKLHDFKEDMI